MNSEIGVLLAFLPNCTLDINGERGRILEVCRSHIQALL